MRARDPRQQRERGVEARLEGLEVAVVDADDGRAERHGPVELRGGMHLDEGGQADALGGVVEIAEPRVIESRHDQQHRIGACGARFPELVLVEYELLAEKGKVHGRAHGDEVTENAAEVLLVGEDGDRRRARPRVDPRLGRGIESGVQRASGGRGLLHLRDEPDAARGRRPQRGLELSRRRELSAGRF